MITFTHCSLARNWRDVTIKHVHTEKHSDVNRRVVAVFKSRPFRHWRYELFQTVCRFVVHISKNTHINFYWNRPSFRRCRHPTKISHVKMTVPFTNGVSAERGTSRLRHRWHRLGGERRGGSERESERERLIKFISLFGGHRGIGCHLKLNHLERARKREGGDFLKKWHFAHLKISFPHPGLPFLDKSINVLLISGSQDKLSLKFHPSKNPVSLPMLASNSILAHSYCHPNR